MVTLAEIRDEPTGALYPRDLLHGCESALVLFAAGFYGKQDAVWIADAGLTATCVDTDDEKLGAMVLAYPEGWEYVHADCFTYASMTERCWDVVSVDCPTNLFDRCAGALPLWCELARKAVVLGCAKDTGILAPTGWAMTDLRYRSSFQGGVYWAVFERC